jgi:hypothetical protein
MEIFISQYGMVVLKNVLGNSDKKQNSENVHERNGTELPFLDKKSELARKWIKVYLSVYFDQSVERSVIEEISSDMLQILINTHSIFTKKGDFLGCVNPYMSINSILTENNPGNLMSYDLSKPYTVSVVDNPTSWNIIIYPVKEGTENIDFYSLERFHWDLFILGHASDYISEKYHIQVHTMEGSAKPEIIQNIPVITHMIRLIVFQYAVIDRYHYQKENPQLDTLVLGGNEQNFWSIINEMMSRNSYPEWTNMVKPILS